MAEIRQKIISCPKGHYYDANRYESCPYCTTGGFSPTVDPFAGAGDGVGQTEYDGAGSGNAYGNFTPTEAPEVKNRAAESMSKTQFVDTSTPTGLPTPVVGWLVAVEGPSRGSDYRIHTGYNYIGREVGDIRIPGDNTISAEKDTNVTYVPQTKKFYIAHEQGKNVLLVNDLPVIGGSMELHDHDLIMIGTTKLMFVGFCGDKFSWGD
ncbi:MAG: FHA domain-containing protein [Lachnospiraceae bacterium]|nr:FHA domain-containing protein [Lachnospiraceae bacterium]MCM1215603.1 FHA domain-containing protein [Lachnospiraceae bacterium]MCM1238526.1 FHA domain-containing protein [Lachnospiraceae bacterium]